MSGFGRGTTCKPTLVRFTANDLLDFTRYTANGTGDTSVVVEDATFGQMIRTTVSDTDNQAGHVYLDNGPITFVANTKFKIVALVRHNGTTSEFGIGLSDGFATANTGIFDNTAATMTSQDSILAYKFSSSLYHRGEIRNASSATASGATTYAFTTSLTYKVEIIGEVQTNGIHVRFFATDMTGAVAGRNNYYTIGYDSDVSPVAASGVDNLQFGWALKTTTTTEVISHVKPLLLEYNTIGT